MKKSIYIGLFTITLIGFIAAKYLYDSQVYLAKYQSPDGNYELIIKSDRSIFASTMPGNGGLGSCPVKVILKGANGKVIGNSNSNKDCGTIMDSIDVRWDLENDEVWYSKARTIDLKTGKVEC